MDRRERERYRIWLPLQVRSTAGETLAVTYDVSEKGVAMLVAEPIPIGAKVTVTFEVPGDPPQTRTGSGQVVRAGPNRDDPHGLWPHRLAVELDEAMEAFEAELKEIARVYALPFGGS